MLMETSSHFLVVLSQYDFESAGPIVTPMYSAAVVILHVNHSSAYMKRRALHCAKSKGESGCEFMTITVLITLSGMAETNRHKANNRYKGNSCKNDDKVAAMSSAQARTHPKSQDPLNVD